MTPLQLGMPYSRPRYYALARQKSADDGSCSFPVPALPSGRPFAGPPGPLLKSLQAGEERGTLQPAEPAGSHAAIAPISQYLDRESAPEKAPAKCRSNLAAADSTLVGGQPVNLQVQQDEHHASVSGKLQAAARNEGDEPGTMDNLHQSSAPASHQHEHDHLESAAVNGCRMPGPSEASAQHEEARKPSTRAEYVPQNVIEQWGQSLDIVGPGSRRCNCFTKTYFRWVKVNSRHMETTVVRLL